jgi:hypothetical protein
MLNKRVTIVTKLTLAAVLLLATLGSLWSGSAPAFTGITSYSVKVSTSQAGGHPDVFIDTKFNNRYVKDEETYQGDPGRDWGCNCDDVKDIHLHMPTGFIGNPHAIPKCSLTEFALNTCSPDTQVGVVFFETGPWNEDGYPYEEKVGLPLGLVTPIFNLQPKPGEAGAFGSQAPLAELPIVTNFSARTEGDYGLDATTFGIFHFLPLPEISLYLWGNPADPSHDASRFPLPHDLKQNVCGGTIFDQVENPADPELPFAFGCHQVVPSGAGNIPFLENPTRCGVPLSAGFELEYYEHTIVNTDTAWPSTTGCDQLTFSPSMTAKPTTTQAETASGLDLALKAPQTQNPHVPSPSEIRAVTVTLPRGFSLTPGGSDGKVSCLNPDLNFNSREAAECPEFAKIGTSTLDSSALPGPISGAIYIGQPLPGQRFRIFLTADGFATHVKLKGTVDLNAETGQIVTKFADLPQSPFEEFDMHFFGSERGIFATPAHCGTYPVETEFVPWDEALPTQTSHAAFEIDSGPNGATCPGTQRPFEPRFRAGTPDNTAGVTTPLTVQVKREDADQFLSGITVTLPPGLIQSIKGIPECPQVALDMLALTSHTGLMESAIPACPAASQIGTVVSGAGAGTRALYNSGKVYLAGPYKGAPLSLVVVVPALGGPYDLGNVTVRAGAYVDPRTAQVKTLSDPLPQILEGVPLRVRSLLFEFTRPGFNRTPTNCGRKSIDTEIIGSEGAIATPSNYYQVGNCGSLPYRPKLKLRLTGGVKRRGHPAIHATLKAKPGEANLDKVVVTLPRGELLDNAHIGTVCTSADFARRTCPDGSLIGRAEATTPLLDKPLSGPVYLRSSSHRLPDLVFDLGGQIDLEVVGRVDAVHGSLRTTFEGLPDAPVDSFELNLLGGAKGLLNNSESLCGVPRSATVRMIGQNGAKTDGKTRLSVSCSAHSRAGRRSQRPRATRAVQ